MQFSEQWLRSWVNPALNIQALSDRLTMAGLEIEDLSPVDSDDMLVTLKITPNRADCLSIRGVAREVAALTGSVLNPVKIAAVLPVLDEVRSITIDCPAQCGRYIGRIVRGIDAAASIPIWMRQRLERSGIRSISAVVDITNYVLLEQGQPMHAFNLARLHGGITIRMAQAGEHLLCLNEQTVELRPHYMVVADEQGPLAIAGVMGGATSGVTLDSTDVFLESAFFAPDAIQGCVRELGLSSDAAYRFERGVDFELQRTAMERATQLVLEICGGKPGRVIETVGMLPQRLPVLLRTHRAAKVLGLQLGQSEIATILTHLGFSYQQQGDAFMIEPPSFRFDLAIEEDLIEEVARIHGYAHIPDNAPRSGIHMLPLPEAIIPRDIIRHTCAQRDYQEVVSYAFVDEALERDFAANTQPIRLLNPIATHMGVMRSSLIGGLVNILANNIRRQYSRIRLFEIARVFHKATHGFLQPEMLTGLAWGPCLREQWGIKTEKIDFFDAKADVEALFYPQQPVFSNAAHPAFHPGRCAKISLNGKVVGIMGELHPKWVQQYALVSAPIVFELDYMAVSTRIQGRVVQPVNKFQAVRRDLALVVEDTISVADLLSCFEQHRTAIVKDIALFDLYKGQGIANGKKSLAFRIILQDWQRTLTDQEVEQAVYKLLQGAEQQLSAQLRY